MVWEVLTNENNRPFVACKLLAKRKDRVCLHPTQPMLYIFLYNTQVGDVLFIEDGKRYVKKHKVKKFDARRVGFALRDTGLNDDERRKLLKRELK